MIKYILRRLLLIIPVLLGAIIVVFTINYFSTTDPAMIKLGISASDPVKLAATRETMGLNRPYIVQLADYIWNLLHGNLGDSYVYSKTVWELLAGRIPNTLKLGLGAIQGVLQRVPAVGVNRHLFFNLLVVFLQIGIIYAGLFQLLPEGELRMLLFSLSAFISSCI